MSETEITRCPSMNKRMDNGAVKFGSDWPGVFIRGDNAMSWAATIDGVLERLPTCSAMIEDRDLDGLNAVYSLRGLSELLRTACLDWKDRVNIPARNAEIDNV